MSTFHPESENQTLIPYYHLPTGHRTAEQVLGDGIGDCRRERKATVDELWEMAGVCRVRKVMRPYLEALA